MKDAFPRALELAPPGRRKKALRYVKEEDRLRSLSAALLMRTFLGAEEDGDVLWDYQGRPELKKGLPFFSLSHSGGYAALSAASFRHGLDVEDLSRPVKFESLLNRALSPEESGQKDFLSQDARAFFRLWTRKESLLKALGLGLRLDPASFSVSPLFRESVAALGREWFFHTIEFDGHLFTLAADRGPLAAELFPVSPKELLEP
ncbi:MAG: 4'-phosphopantetheinyl transferase superfamily protein [Deltaproteobacteria bacterium]|nr:4'-phosphopantetheinyl transferase superfamily protein [Deltaproteobacteria bacterium]